MKILMVCDFYNVNLEYQENLLSKYYTKLGHEVVIIATTNESIFEYTAKQHDKNVPPRIDYHNGVKIIRLKYDFNYKNMLKRFTSLTQILEAEKPDLIYYHDVSMNFREGVAYVKTHPATKMIMDFHIDYSNSGRTWKSKYILHRIIKRLFFFNGAKKYLSKILPVVPASAIFLKENYGVPYEKMEIMPLGADLDLINELKEYDARKEIRNNLRINDSDFVVFSGGKLTPHKKTEILIESFENLYNDNSKKFKNAHLIIVGDSTEKDADYFEKLKKYGQKNKNIHFVGWLNPVEIYKNLLASDIAVFPQSQSVLWQKAISTGLPLVIGLTFGNTVNYLNEKNCILVMEDGEMNAQKIAEHIYKLYSDASFYKKMQTAAFETTSELLDWNNIVKKTLS